MVILALLPNNKFAIGINGAIPFNHTYLIHDMRPMLRPCFLLNVLDVLMLGDVVTRLAPLLMHVDRVEVDRLHILLRTHQLTLTLALHTVLVVVLVRRRLHLLVACCRLLGSPYTTQEGIIVGSECRGGRIVLGILTAVEVRGILLAKSKEKFAITPLLVSFCGFGGGAEMRGVLSRVAVLPLTCVFIFIIHFNAQPRRYFLSALLYIYKLFSIPNQEGGKRRERMGRGGWG